MVWPNGIKVRTIDVHNGWWRNNVQWGAKGIVIGTWSSEGTQLFYNVRHEDLTEGLYLVEELEKFSEEEELVERILNKKW